MTIFKMVTVRLTAHIHTQRVLISNSSESAGLARKARLPVTGKAGHLTHLPRDTPKFQNCNEGLRPHPPGTGVLGSPPAFPIILAKQSYLHSFPSPPAPQEEERPDFKQWGRGRPGPAGLTCEKLPSWVRIRTPPGTSACTEQRGRSESQPSSLPPSRPRSTQSPWAGPPWASVPALLRIPAGQAPPGQDPRLCSAQASPAAP